MSLALTNIDKAKVRYADVRDAIHNARKKYPLIPSGFLEVNQIAHSSSWYINHSGTADLGRVDATDPVERTKAECFSRRQALQMVQALRESDNPGPAADRVDRRRPAGQRPRDPAGQGRVRAHRRGRHGRPDV